MNRHLLIDLADDALDRLDRMQRWWQRQSPHPALSQFLITLVILTAAAGTYAGTDATMRVTIGMSVCVFIGWLCAMLGCVRTVGSVLPQPSTTEGDDATVDIDPDALSLRRRLRLWSACFWWLQLPWMLVVAVRAVLIAIALIGGSPTSRVGLGCTLVPIWAVSVPVGLGLWQRHFRILSRASGSRTEDDLDGRVWWFGAGAIGVSFVWAGLLII